jgi:glycine cleavage system aminomethyltransferase T
LREGIALALLESNIKIGDKVFVDVRGKNVEFLVTKPPFVESKVR